MGIPFEVFGHRGKLLDDIFILRFDVSETLDEKRNPALIEQALWRNHPTFLAG
jgi:hypothetical protein